MIYIVNQSENLNFFLSDPRYIFAKIYPLGENKEFISWTKNMKKRKDKRKKDK